MCIIVEVEGESECVEEVVEGVVENIVEEEMLVVEEEERVLFNPLSFLNNDLKLENRF